jgi:multicomponent Na+:H+ antiporter subunit D
LSALVFHFPILVVVVPLMAAPVCIAVRNGTAAWLIAVATSWYALAVSIVLLERVLETGLVVYEIGGWAAPWGIEYRLDAVNAFVLVIVSTIAALVMPYARASAAREIDEERLYLFYAMLVLCFAGLLGITVTGDAFNLFVFLEISSLSSYVLIAMGRNRRALTAAYRYLIMGTIGATFYIIGVGLMYMMTGSLNMADLAGLLPTVAGTKTLLVALAFLTIGLSIKVALFPLHGWLPNAYAYAPAAVTAFLAATATKVAIYAFLRINFTIFHNIDWFERFRFDDLLIALSLGAMFIASLVAIFQRDVKRMLAYSSIAQIGYIMLGVALLNTSGLTAGIVHLFNHALTKGALFMAVGCVFLRLGDVRLDAFAGAGRRMPWTMAAFVLAGLSLIGIPGTVGFISKWYLIRAALEVDAIWLAILVVVSSLLAIVYVWRVVEMAFFREPREATGRCEAPLSMLVPLWIMTLAVYAFGIDASRTVSIAESAARLLLEGGR